MMGRGAAGLVYTIIARLGFRDAGGSGLRLRALLREDENSTGIDDCNARCSDDLSTLA